MSYHLEYFAEFLTDPSVPDINEFFRMLHEWINYLEAHKNEFNYLEDDEWTEIRERLLDEMDLRFDRKKDLEDEWDALSAECEKLKELSEDEALELSNRQLAFMKNYQDVFKISDTDIVEYEKVAANYARLVQAARITGEAARIAKIRLEESIAALDESLVKYYERTGKIPMLPVYRDKKTYKGN